MLIVAKSILNQIVKFIAKSLISAVELVKMLHKELIQVKNL